MKTCDYCHEPFQPRREGQRFCTTPGKNCRQRYHLNRLDRPGTIAGVTQLADGDWSVTVHFRKLPNVRRGDRCALVVGSRQDAKEG